MAIVFGKLKDRVPIVIAKYSKETVLESQKQLYKNGKCKLFNCKRNYFEKCKEHEDCRRSRTSFSFSMVSLHS